jgi:hypothetical protein
MSKTKKPPVDRAVATIKKPIGTDTLKVSVTGTVAQAMAKSPDWAAATDVQSAVNVWTASATALDANAKVIAGLRSQLAVAEAKQNGLRRDWAAAKAHVVSAVTLFCGGSADKVKGFNLDVLSRTRRGALEAPIDVAVSPGTAPGTAVSTWSKGNAGHGFLVQHATDPSNPAALSTPAANTKTSITLSGLTPGVGVSVRVAAIDPSSPTGQSPWSAWTLGNAR